MTRKSAQHHALAGLLALIICLVGLPASLHALERSDVFATGTVHSFGSYRIEGRLGFDTAHGGAVEIGRLQVAGVYNGPYPWVMRIYTDNTHHQGIAGGIAVQSRAGLISHDGRFVVPLEVHTPNLDDREFLRIPDISEAGYTVYAPSEEPASVPHTERIIMGIDPRNAAWVSGADRVLFTDDDNVLGDITIPTPFTLIFRARFDASSVQAKYFTRLIVEIVGVE